MQESKSFGKIANFFIILCVSVSIITVNFSIITNLNPVLQHHIGPGKIDMAFFNKNEINQIENTLFIKNDLFKYRFVSKLSDVLFSEDKALSHKKCSTYCNSKNRCRTTCTNYYLHFLYVNIECTEESKMFYHDCSNATNLKLGFKYLDEGQYPTYSCAIVNNETCNLGCQHLSNNYGLYLVQQHLDVVEIAWKGLCNCMKKIPYNIIHQDLTLNLCYSNAFILTNNLIVLVSCLICILVMTRI